VVLAATQMHHKGTKNTKKNLCELCAFVVKKIFAVGFIYPLGTKLEVFELLQNPYEYRMK
jgi:hypothetical protein